MVFLYSLWINVPFETRMKIASQFGIKKVGSTVVSDNKVKDDGYNIHDVEKALTPEALKEYIGPTSVDLSMSDLWIEFINKVEGKIPPMVEKLPEVKLVQAVPDPVTLYPAPEKDKIKPVETNVKKAKKSKSK